jgi:thiol-disulfide isomerase/thioredoxin
MKRWLGLTLLVALALVAALFLFRRGPTPPNPSLEPEARIVEYLRANVTPGKPVIVSELRNKVFTTPEERRVLDRLFNEFFKIPLTAVQFQSAHNRIPTIEELSEQLSFKVPGEMDVMLRIMESDPRIPRFFERNSAGEITRIDTEAIANNGSFGKFVDRTIAGWEGKPEPSFSVDTFSGQTLDSHSLNGQPHLIYFWFSNCPPCVKTAPLLANLYQKYSAKGLKIVAANADHILDLPDTDADRTAYIHKTGMDAFQNVHLSKQMQESFGGVLLFPTMVFVDRQGKIVKHLASFQEESDLDAAILAAVKE